MGEKKLEADAERERFTRYLKEKQLKHGEKYAAALGEGTRTGATAVFRDQGLCPADRCILTLNRTQAEKLARWWQDPDNRKKVKLNSVYRSALGHWLDYRALSRKPDRTPAAPPRPEAAPAGFTLAELLEDMTAPRESARRLELLQWLTDRPRLAWEEKKTWALLRGQSPDYPALCRRVQKRLEPGFRDHLAPPEELPEQCRRLLECLGRDRYGAMLAQPGPYAGSQAEAVEGLDRCVRRFDFEALPRALFTLLARLLDPEDRGALPGRVSCSGGLWDRNAGFFWRWLEALPQRQAAALTGELLNGLGQQSGPEACLEALSDRWLSGRGLPVPWLREKLREAGPLPEQWTPIPPEELEEGLPHRGFEAVLTADWAAQCLEGAQKALAAGRPADRPALRQALSRLLRAERCLPGGEEAGVFRQSLRLLGGRSEPMGLPVRVRRLQAACRRRLAEGEAAEGLLACCDLPPILEACFQALEQAEDEAGIGAPGQLEAVRREVQACCDLFFGPTGLERRLTGPVEPGDRESCRLWEQFWRERWPWAFQWIPWQRSSPAWAVSRPPSGRSTVSQDLDSVARFSEEGGLDGEDRAAASVVRETASGRDLVLMLNMAAENPYILKMSASPGFRELCRRGFITVSPFRSGGHMVSSPREYLLQCLLKPGYIWSGTDLFRLPEELAGRTGLLEPGELPGARGEMFRYLSHEMSISEFSPQWREPLGELAEQYTRIDEMIRPSAARRYRQTATLPGYTQLYRPVQQRLGALLAEAHSLGEAEREKRLLAIERLGLDGADGPVLRAQPFAGWERLKSRSAFLSALGQARSRAGAEERVLLDDLECVVHHAYILLAARGPGSSCLLTVQPERKALLLRGDRTEDEGAISHVRRRSQIRETPWFSLDHPDDLADAYWRACELNLRARQKAEDRHLSSADRHKLLRELAEQCSGSGCRYMASGGGLAVGEYTLRTGTGRCLRERYGSAEQRGESYVEEHERED